MSVTTFPGNDWLCSCYVSVLSLLNSSFSNPSEVSRKKYSLVRLRLGILACYHIPYTYNYYVERKDVHFSYILIEFFRVIPTLTLKTLLYSKNWIIFFFCSEYFSLSESLTLVF